ncbi:aminodeoxychorismate/anthranilate synthase component II [bacterium LRH843]|nr:aminodeoxychorismate/anthranilate synthase component II [bacterium LRH843]
MIVMIDNYDSFTYNLVQYLGEMGHEVVVYRNDKVTTREIEEMDPDYLMISPGPGTPSEAGISLQAINHFAGKIPILGVCLGHQAIAVAFGGEVIRAERLMHGKTSALNHDGKTIFEGLPLPLIAARYHSLLVNRDSLPPCFEVSAETAEGEVMAIRHRDFSIEGVQFHPESIMTIEGKSLLRNFIDTYGRKKTHVHLHK